MVRKKAIVEKQSVQQSTPMTPKTFSNAVTYADRKRKREADYRTCAIEYTSWTKATNDEPLSFVAGCDKALSILSEADIAQLSAKQLGYYQQLYYLMPTEDEGEARRRLIVLQKILANDTIPQRPVKASRQIKVMGSRRSGNQRKSLPTPTREEAPAVSVMLVDNADEMSAAIIANTERLARRFQQDLPIPFDPEEDLRLREQQLRSTAERTGMNIGTVPEHSDRWTLLKV